MDGGNEWMEDVMVEPIGILLAKDLKRDIKKERMVFLVVGE